MVKNPNNSNAEKHSIIEETLQEISEFFHPENTEQKLDHRAKFKDEDGCARYDDLWGG